MVQINATEEKMESGSSGTSHLKIDNETEER